MTNRTEQTARPTIARGEVFEWRNWPGVQIITDRYIRLQSIVVTEDYDADEIAQCVEEAARCFQALRRTRPALRAWLRSDDARNNPHRVGADETKEEAQARKAKIKEQARQYDLERANEMEREREAAMTPQQRAISEATTEIIDRHLAAMQAEVDEMKARHKVSAHAS